MLTLNSFFEPSRDDIIRAAKSRSKEVQAVLLGPFEQTLHEEAQNALNISIPGILVRAWSQYDDVKKHLVADATSLLPLVEHSIVSNHEPYVQISRAGTPLFQVHFGVTLTMAIEGLVLKIRSHRIEQIAAGKFTASGELQCEGVTIGKKESKPLAIPGSYVITPEDDAALAAGSD